MMEKPCLQPPHSSTSSSCCHRTSFSCCRIFSSSTCSDWDSRTKSFCTVTLLSKLEAGDLGPQQPRHRHLVLGSRHRLLLHLLAGHRLLGLQPLYVIRQNPPLLVLLLSQLRPINDMMKIYIVHSS